MRTACAEGSACMAACSACGPSCRLCSLGKFTLTVDGRRTVVTEGENGENDHIQGRSFRMGW